MSQSIGENQISQPNQSVNSLGRLEKVELRDVWLSEPTQFTAWLAQEENISMLGEVVGLDLEVVKRERAVGRFWADLLCKDTLTSRWVLIENQLERTDHKHLGQVLTYAANLDATTVVWVAQRFTEEHRAALDWLNRVTSDDISFFGIEIELLRIGNSLPAPNLKVVSKPINFTGIIADASERGPDDFTDTERLRLEYWTHLSNYLSNNRILSCRKPSTDHWYSFATGSSDAYIDAKINTIKHRVSVNLVLHTTNAKAIFSKLEQNRIAIEEKVGAPLTWRELLNTKRSCVEISMECEPTDRADWERQNEWLRKYLESFYLTFSPYLREFKTAQNFDEELKGQRLQELAEDFE